MAEHSARVALCHSRVARPMVAAPCCSEAVRSVEAARESAVAEVVAEATVVVGPPTAGSRSPSPWTSASSIPWMFPPQFSMPPDH